MDESKPKSRTNMNIICEVCGKNYTRLDNYEYHLAHHRNLREFKCTLCTRDFNTKADLTQHLHRSHKVETKELICVDCAKKFTDPEEFKAHRKTHIETKKAVRAGENLNEHHCEQCNKSFGRKRDHDRHKTLVHNKTFKMYCNLCKVTYGGEQEYFDHFDIRHSDLKFRCNICKKRFQSANSEMRHIREIHMDTTIYKCEHCPSRTFKTRDIFRAHKIAHQRQIAMGLEVKEIPLHCNQRPIYKKVTEEDLNIEIPIHRYCNLCKVPFDYISEYTKHNLKYHPNAITCKICDKVFKKRYSLKRHMDSRHDSRPGTMFCDFCPSRTFQNRYQIVSHMRQHLKQFRLGLEVREVPEFKPNPLYYDGPKSEKGIYFSSETAAIKKPKRTKKKITPMRAPIFQENIRRESMVFETMKIEPQYSSEPSPQYDYEFANYEDESYDEGVNCSEWNENIDEKPAMNMEAVHIKTEPNEGLAISSVDVLEEDINPALKMETDEMPPMEIIPEIKMEITNEDEEISNGYENMEYFVMNNDNEEDNEEENDDENDEQDHPLIELRNRHNRIGTSEEQSQFEIDRSIKKYLEEQALVLLESNVTFTNAEETKKYIRIKNIAERLKQIKLPLLAEIDEHILIRELKIPKCKICGLETSSLNNLRTHVSRFHLINGNFECEYCGEDTKYKSKLANHIAKYHKEKIHEYDCFKCDFRTSTVDELHVHIRNVHRFKVKTISKNRSREERLLRKTPQVELRKMDESIIEKLNNIKKISLKEIDEKIDKSTTTCKVCNSSYAQFKTLREHVKRKHFDNTMTCEHCNMIFPHDISLMHHIMSHHRERRHDYPCNKCDKKFAIVLRLKNHIDIYHTPSVPKPRRRRRKPSPLPSTSNIIREESEEMKIMLEEVVEDEKQLKRLFDPSDLASRIRSTFKRSKLVAPKSTKTVQRVLLAPPEMRSEIESRRLPADQKQNLHKVLENVKPSMKRNFQNVQNLRAKSSKMLGRFQCDQCGKRYDQKSFLLCHLLSEHADQDSLIASRKSSQYVQTFDCGSCGKYFCTNKLLEFHVHEHHEPDKYKCDGCERKFLNSNTLSRHQQKILPRRGFIRCHYCYEFFRDQIKLHRHMFIHFPERQIQCHLCTAVFARLSHYSRHLKVIHENYKVQVEKEIFCNFCHEKLKTASKKVIHNRNVHDGGKQPMRKCQPCQFECMLFTDYKKHIEDFHNIEHYCQVCGLPFRSEIETLLHQKVHSKRRLAEKIVHCDVCGHRTATKSLMEVHMRNHSGETPFICDVCGKGFTAFSTFEYHKKAHTGIKDQVCEICGKGYYLLRDLKWHIKSYHSEKGALDRMCKICGRICCSRKGLVEHLQTHEETRVEIRCEFCNQEFKMRVYLSDHIKKEHPEKSKFPCHICNLGFRHRYYYETHVKKVHS